MPAFRRLSILERQPAGRIALGVPGVWHGPIVRNTLAGDPLGLGKTPVSVDGTLPTDLSYQ